VLPENGFNTPATLCLTMADGLRRAIAGSSGPFYAVGLARAAKLLDGKAEATGADWLAAFTAAIDAVEELGGARTGDRTMIDALRPAAAAWATALSSGRSPREAFQQAVDAARNGAAATADMFPALGRASYLGERATGVPDGGARAVAIWLEAIELALPFTRHEQK
jgi:dihydroxyacetone kinase